MSRSVPSLAVLVLLAATVPVQAQVVETSPPAPVRTDESVTITFHADRGSGGLEDCDCDVYAHTGLTTSEGVWRYVMDDWPNNRPKTKLTQVGENTYELTIPDIREYYSDNNTGYGPVPPESEEEIQTMNFVFRNADGSKEGKTADGGDIFVDVNDVQGDVPGLSVDVQNPTADSLYPFIAATDTTVDVSVTADTFNVDSFEELRLLVGGQPVDSTSSTSLTHSLSLTEPGRYPIRAEARASVGDSTLTDSVETFVIRSPDVVDQDRPPGVKDGITYHDDGSVTLSLFAPEKEFAYVIGDFTDWAIDNQYFMKREQTPNGSHWWVTLDGLNPQAQHDFQYYVGGAERDVRVADPFSHKVRTPVDDQISDAVYPGLQPYPTGETEGLVSVLRPDQSDFDFSAFDPPPQEDLVIYELLLRDFVERSSFSVLADTLSYLDSLGVNAVELLPVSNFEGHGFWGYRPNAHLAVDKSYGPPEGLKQFVEAAHNRGIAVILDVVYNHITSNSAIARLYESAAENPFLESGPNRGICGAFFQELNQGHPFIKRYIRRANEYWLEEFNVDGFRFDVAHCVADNGVNINDPGHNDALRSGWKTVADSVWSVNPDAYVALEMFGAAGVKNDLGSYGGVGNTGGMLTWHKMSDPYSRADRGDLQGGSDLSSSYFGNRPNYDQPSGITYMTSHDEQWLMRLKKALGTGDATYSTQDFETALDRQKLVGAFFYTVPGPRLMWQFGEVGYGWGPDECLRPFAGEDLCPPSAPIRIGPKPVRWAYADSTQSPERDALYKTWKALIRLRNDHEVFSRARTGSGEEIAMRVASDHTVRCIRLEDENLDATIVGNFGLTRRTASLQVGPGAGACSVPQTGTWHNYFEDDTLQVSRARQLRLRPGEFRIYTSQPQPAPPMGLVPSAPIHRTRIGDVSTAGEYDFGDTGVDIAFEGTGGSGTVTVEKLDEAPLGTKGIAEDTVSQYRFVAEAGGSLGFDGSTEIQLDVSTLGGVATPNNVTIYHRPTEDAGSFTALTTTYNESEGELTAPIDTSGALGEFVLASNSEGLPVEMAGFDATTRDEAVRLTWQTAAETNNAEFRIQRRTGDGANGGAGAWTTVGAVEGAGSTTEVRRYQFTDNNLPFATDRLEYRLVQVDTDGRVHYSKTVAVERPVDDVVLRGTFPNPARGQVTVQYALPEARTATLRLYDMLGRRVKSVAQSKQQGRRRVTLDVSGLTSGVYFLRLTVGETIRTQKLTVVQ
ncbi:MAG: alpha-amylase family glycosyl hydrolase [Salinibacter sp.]